MKGASLPSYSLLFWCLDHQHLYQPVLQARIIMVFVQEVTTLNYCVLVSPVLFVRRGKGNGQELDECGSTMSLLLGWAHIDKKYKQKFVTKFSPVSTEIPVS